MNITLRTPNECVETKMDNIITWPPIGLLSIHLKQSTLKSLQLLQVAFQLKRVIFGLHTISRILCWMNERYAHI